jgi:ribosomal-protein-serine acetyltransferase
MSRPTFSQYPSAMPTLQLSTDAQLSSLEASAPGELLGFFERNNEYMRAWCPWVENLRSLESVEGMIASARRNFDEQNAMWMVIRYRDAVVGVAALHELCAFRRRGSLGCMLDQMHEGLGLASRAVVALTCYAMDVLGLIRVEAQAAVGNARAIKVAEHLGFRFEGILRCSQWLHGRPVDNAVYSITTQDPRPPRFT